MSNIYVYSSAAGTGDGSSWANAYTTLKAAAEAAGTAAGDDIWVAHDHAETTASALTITFKGSGASPTRVVCVNRAGSVPPVAADIRATATVTTTGNSTLSLQAATSSANYVEGIIFSCGTGAVNAAISIGNGSTQAVQYFKNCTLGKLGTTGVATAMTIGATGRNRTILENCILQFGAAGDGLRLQSDIIFKGGSLAGVAPTSLIPSGGTSPQNVLFDGFDFTNISSGTINNQSNSSGHATLVNCKLAAGTVISGAPSTNTAAFDTVAVNCDGGATNYRTEKYMFGGSQVIETTIVRTGGASDGTTLIAWKIVTTASVRQQYPFECIPITVWNDTPGAKTVSIYGYWNNAAVPTNAQIWMEAEYLGNASYPVSSFISSGLATVLTAASNIPSDASAWGGGVTTSKFKMSVSLTTAMKGPISVKVYVAATGTFYIDPKIEVV